jgi:transcriptional regulator with XRE-family HTH domain
LRSALEITQEELARRARLDAKHIQAIEAGDANVTVSTLLGLAVGLECDVADLFNAE